MIRFQSNYHGNLVFKKQVLTAHSELKASYRVIISIFDQNEEELLIKDFQTCGNIAHIVDTRLGGDVKVQIKHKGGFSRHTSLLILEFMIKIVLLGLDSPLKQRAPIGP